MKRLAEITLVRLKLLKVGLDKLVPKLFAIINLGLHWAHPVHADWAFQQPDARWSSSHIATETELLFRRTKRKILTREPARTGRGTDAE